MNFKQYLYERHTLTHLEHVEDLVFIEGYKGAEKTLKYLSDIVKDVSNHKSNMVIQQKVDGAPSIIAGWSPEDGRFFVATKSFFNKTQKINFTKENIASNHGTGELANKLNDALDYLPAAIKKNEIVQGDFMYSKNDLKQEKIDGVKVITFTPNTITYAVPSDTPLYKTIIDSEIGIIWHTTYTGSTLDSLSGSFKISNNQFKNTKKVYTRTTNSTVSDIGWDKETEKNLNKEIKILEQTLKTIDKKQINEIASDNKISSIVKTFINSKVKNNNNKFDKNEIKNLIDFIDQKYKKEIDKLKSEKGKTNKTNQKNDFINNVRLYASTLYHLFEWTYNVQKIKLEIIRKLEELNSPETPYIRTSDGYQITSPEGFVLSNSDESGVKFVNRAVFSRQNFLNSKF